MPMALTCCNESSISSISLLTISEFGSRLRSLASDFLASARSDCINSHRGDRGVSIQTEITQIVLKHIEYNAASCQFSHRAPMYANSRPTVTQNWKAAPSVPRTSGVETSIKFSILNVLNKSSNSEPIFLKTILHRYKLEQL